MSGAVVVCVLVEQMPQTPIPSVMRTCAQCGRRVWLSLNADHSMETWCITCAVTAPEWQEAEVLPAPWVERDLE